MIEEKVWGRVHHVVMSSKLMVSVLEVNAGTFCSVHRHHYRTNQFKVVSGQLRIARFGWDDKGPSKDPFSYAILRPGDEICVPELEWHQFIVDQDGVVIEVYHPAGEGDEVRLDDIERHSLGGIQAV